MRRGPILALLLALSPPAAAQPNAQLVASVQQRLDALGFAAVDAGGLSTMQIAALHLELDGRSDDISGFPFSAIRQRVKVILGLN